MDSGHIFDRSTVPAELCQRPFHVLLDSFGNLLPTSWNNPAFTALRNRSTASWTALYPSELKAHLLHTLLGVQFRWVDTLALHLIYDRSTRTLSLFSFPSVCFFQLSQRRGTIFGFVSTEELTTYPRASEDEIAHFLIEVLISYRLLFDQSAKSCKLFRRLFNLSDTPSPQPDWLLALLCAEKQHPFAEEPGLTVEDRRVDYAPMDFLILYDRIERLAKELAEVKPKSMGDLLRDRRDTLQFWTFWFVAAVGGASVGLSLIQDILMSIQIAKGAGKI